MADILNLTEQKPTVDFRSWAVYYARLGLRVLPIAPRGKIPLIKSWPKAASTNLEQIGNWWDENSNANIGIAMGAGSGLIDIECDIHADTGIDGVRELAKLNLPRTWAFRSGGGGVHYLFKAPEGATIKNRVGLLPGVDVRGQGGQSVFPPSVHTSGNFYSWLDGCSPEAMPQGAAALPFELLELLREDSVRTASNAEFHEGCRNNSLYKIASALRGEGYEYEAIFERIATDNAERCIPPLPLSEIETICTQAAKLPLGEAIDWQALKQKAFNADLDDGRAFAEFVGGRLVFTNGRGWLSYQSGIWSSDSHSAPILAGEYADKELAEAKRAARQAAGFNELKTTAEAARKRAKRLRGSRGLDVLVKVAQPYLTLNDTVFDAAPDMLATPVGAVNLRTGEIRESTANDYFSFCTAVSPARTEQGTAMWNAVLKGVTGGDVELMKYLQLIAGSALIGKVFGENLFLVYGPGGTGKSTFWNPVKRVLGTYAVGIAPEVLLTNYGHRDPTLASLLGKRFALAAELEEGVRLSSSTLKRLASTDDITAKALYRDPVTFAPTHTMVLYSNFLPKVGSTDSGTWRRIKVLPFVTRVQGKPTPNFGDVLFRVAGGDILSWLIDGAKQFIAGGCILEEPLAVELATAKYRSENDWMQAFLDECCVVEANTRTQAATLYNAYDNFATTRNDYRRSVNDFAAELEARGFKKIRPKGTNHWLGICLRDQLTSAG